MLRSDERVLAEPTWAVGVLELGASSVELFVRPWAASADYGAVSSDLKERVKAAFDAHGMTIPYPRMDVSRVAEEPAAAALPPAA